MGTFQNIDSSRITVDNFNAKLQNESLLHHLCCSAQEDVAWNQACRRSLHHTPNNNSPTQLAIPPTHSPTVGAAARRPQDAWFPCKRERLNENALLPKK